MKNCILFSSGLLACLLSGCAAHSASNSDRPDGAVANHFRKASPAGSTHNDSGRAVIASEPNGILTLRHVLALTLMNNPVLKAYSLETRAAEARALQAGLRPNPELGIEIENVGGSGPLRRFDSAETTVQISQLIELGDKARKRQTVALLKQELSEWDYEIRRVEMLTAAGKAFIELLAIQEKTRLLSERVHLSEQIFGSVVQRVEAGKDSPLEKTKASVALSTIRIEHRQAMLELETARKILSSFWGSESPRFTQAQGQLDAVSDIPEMDVLRQRLANTPQLARWETEIAANRAAAELAKSKAVPDIALGAGARRFHQTDENAFVFGVSIPLPLSDRNQGARMEAAYNLSGTFEKQREARIEVTNRFHQIYTKLAASSDKIRELKDSVLPGAREVVEATQEAYVQGKIDYLNVLDAQRTYFMSQTDYLEALTAFHKAKADMEGLIGDMNQTKWIQP